MRPDTSEISVIVLVTATSRITSPFVPLIIGKIPVRGITKRELCDTFVLILLSAAIVKNVHTRERGIWSIRMFS